MSNALHWLLEMLIEEANLAEFKAVMADMVASTEQEDGTLVYDWCFSEDAAKCQGFCGHPLETSNRPLEAS